VKSDPKNDVNNPPLDNSCGILSSALAQLRFKLLDLTSRNRLLNFKYTAGKSLQFVEGQPTDIYQKLVESNNKPTISILGLPEPSRRDCVERNGRLERPDPNEWAKIKGISRSYDLTEPDSKDEQPNVRALFYPDDLAKHCRKIEREAVLAIEETGANKLFLVLGFLDFPEQRDSDRIFSAPLISIPVVMSKSVLVGTQVFNLQSTGDEISENLSLREKLKNDYDLTLPELDEDQINVEQYFSNVSKIIESYPRFAVKRRVSLCLLSFTNMLLVRDLDPNKWPQIDSENGLLDHPVVRKVIEGGSGEAGSGLGIADEHPVEDVPGANIPLVYDADSSQHSALVDVLIENKTLVIEGPPGTGKSQTITNLIAACLSEGKTVLFVAEKLAALDVVKNRLTLAGLDPFVLELHSNKTNKKRVLEEIGKRVSFSSDQSRDLPRLLQHLESHRNDLKGYTNIINSVSHNTFGLTLHQIIWRSEKHRMSLNTEEAPLTQIAIADGTQISEFELLRRMDCLKHLGSQYASIGGFDIDSTFWGFFPERIVPGDEVRLTNIFIAAFEWTKKLTEDAKTIVTLLGGTIVGLTIECAQIQTQVLDDLLSSSNADLPFHLLPHFFELDKTGERSRIQLEAFAAQMQRYHALLHPVQATLYQESSVTEGVLDGLKKLKHAANHLGVSLETPGEIQSLSERLHQEIQKFSSSVQALKNFTKNKGIHFQNTREELVPLERFSTLIVDAPLELLHLQNPELSRDGAQEAIESLANLQSQWVSLQKELDETLYIDMLPSEETIRQAVFTLREGDSWYRIFQNSWRLAIKLHKKLQRSKQKILAKDRLFQLEKIVNIFQLKEKWKSDPTWSQFLGFPAPVDPSPLDAYITLAKWNHSFRQALEEVQSIEIDLASLSPDKTRALCREYASFKNDLTSAITALKAVDTELPRLIESSDIQTLDKLIAATGEFLNEVQSQLEFLEVEVRGQSTFSSVVLACKAALERSELLLSINHNAEAKRLLDEFFQGVDTNISLPLDALAFGQRIDGLNLLDQIKVRLRLGHPLYVAKELRSLIGEIVLNLSNLAELERNLKNFGDFNLKTWVGRELKEDFIHFSESLQKKIEAAVNDSELLISWSLYVVRRKEAIDFGLIEFAQLLEDKKVDAAELADAYAYCTYATIVREAFRKIPQLGRFSGLKHNQIRDEFKRLDKEIIQLRGREIAFHCSRSVNIPDGYNGPRVDDKTEMVLVKYLLPQSRPRMPVRKMLKRAGRAIQALKPCFMMGPQAVAQYLTPGAIKFDLVIMDEASQLKPEEAIGAIARGSQLVVVGDPKQLPPTSFFSRMAQIGEDDEQYTTTDAESILDVCSSQFPTRVLRWHYRSQHHSLIAFSNQNFYRGNLIIFPSPYGQSGRLGIRATYLSNAVYENQTNLREAQRVVDAVVEHITQRPDDSLGVVTLNTKQRDLIAELIEERLKSDQGSGAYRERWALDEQPLFIKNLENVQGDERDAIIISTTFGKPAGANAVRQNFGPISRQGGWRRLNVLFTRARKSIAIYTSLRPEDIVMDGTTPDGTKALRNYLEYARTGSLTVAEDTGLDPDSDFEISIMDMLKSRGYEVTPQLGVAGYRIDIAVKHPDKSGSYLAAIECDGASYHSAKSVRDRDRIRQEILESLGWRGRIWRIWSSDWFRSPRQETEKLIGFLDDLSKNWTPQYSSAESWFEEGASSNSDAVISPFTPAEEREVVVSALIDAKDDLAIEVGDVVRYIDITKTNDVLTVRITHKENDFDNGLISKTAPLAQTMLGAVVGDEVILHVPGRATRVFKIIEIKRIE